MHPLKLYITVEKAAPEGFALYVNNKVLKTPQGNPWVCASQKLAEAAAAEVLAEGTKGALYKLQSYVIDTPAAAATDEMADHFETDLVFYEAAEPEDLAAHQHAAWAPVRGWLAAKLGCKAFHVTAHTTLPPQLEETLNALSAYIKGLSREQRAVAYFAGRLAASVCIGLAFAAKELDAAAAHHAAMADEYYQETRYKPDDLLTKRLDENKEQFAKLQNFRDLSY